MDTLLTDLFKAYYDARRNKRNTPSQLRFELNLETNLITLYHELKSRRYRPSPSICFVVQESVKREVFASEFRDRVVHHLYYNYVSDLFDRQFVYDSYSCRKGKGTLMGINRLQHHIRSVSRNNTLEAFVLKMDIKGYFMSIDRSMLCNMVHEMIEKVHLSGDTYDIVCYLTDIITMKNPMQNARIKGNPHDWDDLPPSKCLSYSPAGVGLPIGDLTSQLFSNVFLSKLDWFVSQHLGFKHYGRYVDDFYIVDTDYQRLKNAVAKILEMLSEQRLLLHPRKVKIQSVKQPISYLGAVIRPYYRHASPRTMKRVLKYGGVYAVLSRLDTEEKSLWEQLDVSKCLSSMNSYKGYLSHFKACRKLELVCTEVSE